MRKARSSDPIHQQQQRFCWRERTEKLNWRMLRALHLPDVVKRGDPTVLEPYVLHLTFARLPAAGAAAAHVDSMGDIHGGGRMYAEGSDDQQRNAWFIVRLFQLATEYLLFMRSRDGTVLETLQKELQLCEKATPSAVSAIETLLRDMLPKHKKSTKSGGRNQNGEDDDAEHTQRRIKEARQCYYCGKMFASAEFLEKHHLRRHPGDNRESRIAEHRPSKPIAKPHLAQESSTNSDVLGSGEKALRQMLQQVEHALQGHQESLRLLAKEEARKIESLYEKLHVENQLAEEIKASRILAEKQVEEAQEQLDTVLQEREDALTELSDLKEQIQFLDLKRKMEFQASVRSSPPAQADQKDISTVLEIKRLEQALSMVNLALSDSRKELSKLQETHLVTLKDKQVFCDQLSELQNHIKRLESKISESNGTESVPVVRKDYGSQTVATEAKDVSTQAENEDTKKVETQPKVFKANVAVQTRAEMKPLTGVEIAIQTEKEEERHTVLLSLMQFPDQIETEVTAHGESSFLKTSEQAPIVTSQPDHESDGGSTMVSDYVFNIVADSVVGAVKNRVQRAVEESAKSNRTHTNKSYSSLPGRKLLRSRYHHDEQTVQERIAVQMLKLEQLSHRFGVPPKCNVLSNEHLQIVQQALHGHLEVLPAEVLQKMVECESTVNTIIEKEWIPREKTRQQALERLKVQTYAKSQLNQDLVKQAMTAFTSVIGGETVKQDQSSHSVDPQEERQPVAGQMIQQNCDEISNKRADEPTGLVQDGKPMKEEFGKPFNVKNLTVIIEERPSLTERDDEEALRDLVTGLLEQHVSAGLVENRNLSDIDSQEETESKPVSIGSSVIPPQAIYTVTVPQVVLSEESKPVAMKVVTVSPKSYPAKPEIVNELQEQEVVLDGPPASELSAKKHDFSCLQALESLGESSAAPGTETDVRDFDHVGVHPVSITKTQSVSEIEDEAVSEAAKDIEQQPFAVTPKSAVISDESDGIENVDIQSVPEFARSADIYPSPVGHGVSDSAEGVSSGQRDRPNKSYERDRDTPDRNQVLHSFRSSEFSESMAASSELSFQTSIPSLEESDGNISNMDTTSKSVDEARDSREGVIVRGRFSVESLKSESSMEPERKEVSVNSKESEHDIPILLSDDEAGDLEENIERAPSNATTSQQNSPNTPRARYDLSANTNIMTFSDDDDSEIEEVELT